MVAAGGAFPVAGEPAALVGAGGGVVALCARAAEAMTRRAMARPMAGKVKKAVGIAGVVVELRLGELSFMGYLLMSGRMRTRWWSAKP